MSLSRRVKDAKEKDFFEEFALKEKINGEKIKIMMSNTDYLKWICKFTLDKDGFYDDEWLYNIEEIKTSDLENVEALGLFYEGIDNYAKQNYIFPLPVDFGNFYKVRLNEFGFGIGILSGQGTVFFCKKIPVVNKEEFIDFNDIIIGKQQKNVNEISKGLTNLSNMILAIYENGVPLEAIENTFKNIVGEINSKQEEKIMQKHYNK